MSMTGVLMFQTLGAITALEVTDCCGTFDPATSSVYLALYQVS